MNMLVIGGNGFIGSHLVDKLVEHGHRVRVFDMYPEKYRNALDKVEYVISSVANHSLLAESLIEVDVVFYLASTSVPSTSNLDITTDAKDNLISTLNTMEVIIKQGVRRIIYFSSGGAVYGNPISVPIKEDHPLSPISAYGVHKLAMEKYLLLFKTLYGIDPLIIRPSNPYGPRQGHHLAQGVISTFLRNIRDNLPLSVHGHGNAKKDYIFIEDLISMCYRLAIQGCIGSYNLGAGEGYSINELIKILAEITGVKPKIQYISEKPYDVKNFILSNSKAAKEIELDTKTDIRTGIALTWDWINKVL